jgi:hypothetical protein
VSTKRISVLSDGTPWRPLINVRDMARAIEWAVGRDREAGGDFLVLNAGSDRWNYQVHELAQAVANLVSGTEVSVNEAAPPDRRSYRVDFSLFRRLAPGHQPKWDLHGTIDALRNGLAAIGFADSNFRDSSFMRLRVLTDLRSRGLLSESLEWSAKQSLADAPPSPPSAGINAQPVSYV